MRYTSVAAASVVVVATAALGIHFATKGNGIDYTMSGSSSAAVSTADGSKTNISDTENTSKGNDGLSDFSSTENSEGSSVYDDRININSDVMWGIGKTIDEVTEKYGTVTSETDNVYTFEKGYGRYMFSNISACCKSISKISARDFLVGNLSTITLENFASKCGFEDVSLNDNNDPNTMYDGLMLAYYTHPSYENITFCMVYKQSGFDETATFDIRYDGIINNGIESEISTENGDVFVTDKLLEQIENGTLTDEEFYLLVSYVYSGKDLCTDYNINNELSDLVNARSVYNTTVQKTFNRLMLSGYHENDDEWHITAVAPGYCHSMKEWYDTACKLYADMPPYDDFADKYGKYFKFDESGNFYYSSDRAPQYLISGGMPFNAPSYSVSIISSRSFAVIESTDGGEGLKVGVLYFNSVGTTGTIYRADTAFFDVKKTSDGYRFVVDTNI